LMFISVGVLTCLVLNQGGVLKIEAPPGEWVERLEQAFFYRKGQSYPARACHLIQRRERAPFLGGEYLPAEPFGPGWRQPRLGIQPQAAPAGGVAHQRRRPSPGMSDGTDYPCRPGG